MEEQKRSCELERKGCGGCSMLSMPYRKQLKKKQKRLEQLLGKFGKVQPILGMENPWNYRNKVISTFAKGKGKNLESGIYAQGSHRVLPVKTCFLHQPILDKAVEAVRRAVSDCKYQPYDEDRRTGLIRHVLVRHSLTTDEVMAVLVTASPVLPGAKAFVKKVRELCPNITTIVQNVNARSTSAVLGDREKILYGKGFITDSLCGVRFRIAASSFYQVNPKQTEILYKKAIEAAGLNGKQTVLDAYCGVGTIGLTAAKHAKNVLGVELNKSAVQCAIENAKANHLKNARFLCGDATRFIQKMAARAEQVNVVFMDPPRAGSTPEFLQAVSRMKPEKLVYISCNPETLQRDLEILVKLRWKVERIQGVDLFPMTEHVETVVLLSQQKPDDTIEIDLDLDELDATSAELKATYQEIKDYVLKEFGLKVSNLYISQVKRKCGIEVGENYNLPKSENARVPQCPKEKEEAIKAALKYFAMI